MKFWFGIALVIVAVGAFILLYFRSIPEQNKDIITLGVGILLGWGTTIVNYEWGSSSGSKAKDEKLNGKAGQ